MVTKTVKSKDDLVAIFSQCTYESINSIVIDTVKGKFCVIPEGKSVPAQTNISVGRGENSSIIVDARVSKSAAGYYQYGVMTAGGEVIAAKKVDGVNNYARAEISAVRDALQELAVSADGDTLKNTIVEIYTGSEYVCNCLNQHLEKWPKYGWKKKDQTEILHRDLWEEVLTLKQSFKHVSCISIELAPAELKGLIENL